MRSLEDLAASTDHRDHLRERDDKMLPKLITIGTTYGIRQWWRSPDRQTFHRTRADALRGRNGIPKTKVFHAILMDRETLGGAYRA